MEIRKLTAEHFDAINVLLDEAFWRGRRTTSGSASETPPDDYETTRRLGMFDGTRLVATEFTHDMALQWDHGQVPLGGVAAVTCTASERGKGHVDKLLRQALVDMRENGQYLSGLFPFQYSFYKRYGYGWAGEKYVCSIPTVDLKSSPEGRHLESYIGMDAKDVIAPIYGEFCQLYRGMHLRQGTYPDWWERALAKPLLGPDGTLTYVHVYTNPSSGKKEGYLTYRFASGHEKGSVGEFIALTPDAHRGLLGVLHYYGTQAKTVTLETPADDALPLHVMSWDLERKVSPLFMFRLVDVKAALEALKPDTAISGSVTIAVKDHICDWNDGAFQVAIENGNVSVRKTNTTADISLTIEQLSQAYWGKPGVGLLRKCGVIDVPGEAGFETLSKLLPDKMTYMIEFF